MNLTKTILFNGITEDEIEKMVRCQGSEFIEYPAESTIYDYCEVNDTMGMIVSGKATLVRIDINGNLTIIDRLEENSLFGEANGYTTLSNDSMRIIADTNCLVFHFKLGRILTCCERVCTHHQLLISNLFKLITKKNERQNERIEVLSCRKIRDKIMCYLRMLAKKQETSIVQLPFSISSLSDYLCVDRSAMTRELKSMSEEGLIDYNRRNIKILF